MELRVEPDVLVNALKVCQLVSNTRSPSIESRCVRLKLEGNRLSLTSISISSSIVYWIEVEGEEDGEVAVDLEMLFADVSSIRGTIQIRAAPKNLFIESGRAKRKRRLIPLDSFLDVPKVEGEEYEVDSQELVDILNRVAFSIIKDGSRPELQCVRFAEGCVMGGDGQRMSVYSHSLPFLLSVPSLVLDALSSVLSMTDKVKICLGNWISVRSERCCFQFSGLGYDYPDTAAGMVMQLEKEPTIASYVIDKGVALNILGSLRVYSDRSSKLGIEYAELDDSAGYLRVLTDVQDVGKFEDELVCEGKTGGMGNVKILFSPTSLFEALGSISGNSFNLKVYGATKPLIISDPENKNWRLLQSVMATREMVQGMEEESEDF